MKVTFLRGACCIIEANGIRIMTDPWLTDGIYYGSWAHFPPYEWKDDLSVDYIYVSHIHPDHCDPQTFKRLPKVPVIIHEFQAKFLKKTIEAMGFEVWEMLHSKPFSLGANVVLTTYAADDCNPEICGRFFGCTKSEVETTQIDSMCVITDGKETLVNANDCPYQLSKHMLPKLRNQYPYIDYLLVAYGGAGPYPQCFKMPDSEKLRYAEIKKQGFIYHAIRFAQDLRAKKTMPFAGDYVLQSKMTGLNQFRGVPDIGEVYTAFEEAGLEVIRTDESNPILKQTYIDEVLSKRKLDYENDPYPHLNEIAPMVKAAAQRLEAKRQEIGFITSTKLYLDLDWSLARIPLDGKEMSFVHTIKDESYVKMTVDQRLLKRALSGPKHAHWNNCEIGSHITFERSPDKFERGITHLASFLHT